MSQQKLLKKVINTLEQSGIDYMITGSMASSLQGEPRSTHDIDIVVAVQESDIESFVKAFPSPDYFLDADSMRNAISHKSMFNLLHILDGDKVDFWILTDHPFDQSRFTRKCIEDVMGLKLNVSRPEDTILAKLHWAMKSGGSEKQFIDALRIFEVQQGNLDLQYLNHWASVLHVEELWNCLQKETQSI